MKNLVKTATITAAATLTSTNALAHSGGFAATHDMEHTMWLIIPAIAVVAGAARWLLQANQNK